MEIIKRLKKKKTKIKKNNNKKKCFTHMKVPEAVESRVKSQKKITMKLRPKILRYGLSLTCMGWRSIPWWIQNVSWFYEVFRTVVISLSFSFIATLLPPSHISTFIKDLLILGGAFNVVEIVPKEEHMTQLLY